MKCLKTTLSYTAPFYARVICLKTRSGLQSCYPCSELVHEKQSVNALFDISNITVANTSTATDIDHPTCAINDTENALNDASDNNVTLCDEDAKGMNSILGSLIKDCPPQMLEFLQSQQRALQKSKY